MPLAEIEPLTLLVDVVGKIMVPLLAVWVALAAIRGADKRERDKRQRDKISDEAKSFNEIATKAQIGLTRLMLDYINAIQHNITLDRLDWEDSEKTHLLFNGVTLGFNASWPRGTRVKSRRSSNGSSRDLPPAEVCSRQK